MTKASNDDRSPTSKAMSKVSEILALCLLPVIPTLIGVWIDRKVGSMFLFTTAGLVFGMAGAYLQLKRLVFTDLSGGGCDSETKR